MLYGRSSVSVSRNRSTETSLSYIKQMLKRAASRRVLLDLQ
eukprot:XP_001704637.1 Hypothetical protein GL50803_5479 [Giardia lamblia ATCC 50803]